MMQAMARDLMPLIDDTLDQPRIMLRDVPDHEKRGSDVIFIQ
jgi:hypothetical protein